jgi:hypothetical protein
MRRMLTGALVGAGLVLASLVGTGFSNPGYGPLTAAPGAVGAEGGLVTHLVSADGQPLTLTVVDSRERWIGVYQIDRVSGEISLKSARKITWDTQLVDFNSGKPLPQEIRSGLQR